MHIPRDSATLRRHEAVNDASGEGKHYQAMVGINPQAEKNFDPLMQLPGSNKKPARPDAARVK